MIERLLLVGANYRVVAFLVLVLVTALTSQGLTRLEIDTGFSSMIPDSNPDRQAYLRVSEEFGSDNRTIIYIRDGSLWTPAKMGAIQRLQDDLESLDYVERVDSIINLRTVRGSGRELDSKALLTGKLQDAKAIEAAREDALDNPLIVGNYVSADGSATALMVTIRPPADEPDFDAEVNAALEDAVRQARGSFQQIFQVGPTRINAELKSSLFEDLRLLGPLSAALLALVILLFLGSVFGALLPLLSAALSLIWTFGVMGLLGIPVNILSAMLPSLIIVIGSTEDTHMLSAYFHGLQQSGDGKPRMRATRFMMRKMGVPLFLTVLTTALGFGSNIFGNIDLIRDFALASTFAIVVNGIITVLLVPMVLSIAGPGKARDTVTDGQVPGFTGFIVTLLGFGRQHFASSILILTVAMCGFFVYQASKLYVTNDPYSYFRGDRQLLRDARQLQRDLAGVKVFFVVLESDQDRAFSYPENLERLVKIQDFIRSQGIFDNSISVADHLRLVNREFHGGDPTQFLVPRTRELVSQYLLFFHRRDVQGYLSHDGRRANILVRHNVSDSRTLNPHIAELKQVAQRLAGGGMQAYVVGENLMVNAAAESLITGQAKSLAVLVFVIFIIMSIMFTSFKGGLIALVPSLIPIVLMFGVMGLLGIPLNPGTAMVAVIAVGIAIDGTIHLFSRYNEHSRQNADNEEAVRVTVGEEALPVVATSLALSLGFGILLFSNFTIIAQFGALAAATMLFSVFANLLITPIIMARIRLVGLYDILAMNMDGSVLEESPLFQDMTNYQIRKAILISEQREFAPGSLVVTQGTFGRSMYLVLSGQAEVVRRDGDEARQVAVVGAGTVLGEVGYVREIERTADVRALTHVQALHFDFDRMRRDLRYFPRIVAALNFNISRILGERLADAMAPNTVRTDTQGSRK
ncbi:MAG: efflux RND transporter permease subunit [Pseudomonadota bacterium]